MEELKKFELSNQVLEDFDKLMTYHLDQVEEIEINEIFINPKLYNIISLCTNAKTLRISGDMRVDVNKILFNICKPEKLETLILNSVKLPTTKSFAKFTNLQTISLNNITFSDINGFFNRIVSKEKIIALNLTNVDFGKRKISTLSMFSKLKFLNIDSLKNCDFDDFNFIYENKNMERFEFYNNEIKFDQINTFSKGRYTKNIEVNIETSKECNISNALEIDNDGKISLTVNTLDLEKCIDTVGLYRLNNLFIIFENDIDLEKYIRKFKKVKDDVTLAIRDIAYLNIEEANKFRDKLSVEFVNILENDRDLDINNLKYCYSMPEYIEIREKFDEIVDKISKHTEDLDKFYDIYNYFKANIKYNEEITSGIKDVFINKESSYNFYAIAINSCLKALNLEAKIIGGKIDAEDGFLWNQVKLNDEWYNFDLAEEMKAKADKKALKYVFNGILKTDASFGKNHVATYGEPEVCETELQEMKKEIKKELKNSAKKEGFWNRIFHKIKGVFKFNKSKALPAPEDESKK